MNCEKSPHSSAVEPACVTDTVFVCRGGIVKANYNMGVKPNVLNEIFMLA
jgi:hypothetical protein